MLFFILYTKGKEFTKNFEEAIDILGKEVLIFPTQDGEYVMNDARITLKPALDATSSFFKLSGYATIISVIAAVVTVVFGLIEMFKLF